jgi:hypothetical protein
MVMSCKNPYPCDFDRAMSRKFKSGVEVVVMPGKPNRKEGADESWYVVSYS